MISLFLILIQQVSLISELGVFVPFENKDNLTDSTVWNTGETGDINLRCFCTAFLLLIVEHYPYHKCKKCVRLAPAKKE